MIGLPPGTILQLLYIRKRLKSLLKKDAEFLDVGAGNGMISTELLKMGFKGTAIDMNTSACENNSRINEKYIREERFKVINDNFLNLDAKQFDLIISCMVIEHIPDDILTGFISNCKRLLKENGKIVFLVPSGMKFWGIEDDIAGHIKRYEFSDAKILAQNNNLKIDHIAGLTFPVSNILFNLSNRIVKKAESGKKNLSQEERTIYTGNRNVKFKTVFPSVFNIFLNPVILWPFHLLQLANRNNTDSMILYFELTKKF